MSFIASADPQVHRLSLRLQAVLPFLARHQHQPDPLSRAVDDVLRQFHRSVAEFQPLHVIATMADVLGCAQDPQRLLVWGIVRAVSWQHGGGTALRVVTVQCLRTSQTHRVHCSLEDLELGLVVGFPLPLHATAARSVLQCQRVVKPADATCVTALTLITALPRVVTPLFPYDGDNAPLCFISMVTAFAPRITGHHLLKALLLLLLIQRRGPKRLSMLITGGPKCGKSALLRAVASEAPLCTWVDGALTAAASSLTPTDPSTLHCNHLFHTAIDMGALDVSLSHGCPCLIDDAALLPIAKVTTICDAIAFSNEFESEAQPSAVVVSTLPSSAADDSTCSTAGAATIASGRMASAVGELSAVSLLVWTMNSRLTDELNGMICASSTGESSWNEVRAYQHKLRREAMQASNNHVVAACEAGSLADRLMQAAIASLQDNETSWSSSPLGSLKPLIARAKCAEAPEVGSHYFGLPYEDAIWVAIEGMSSLLHPAQSVGSLFATINSLIEARALADGARVIMEVHVADVVEIVMACLESSARLLDASTVKPSSVAGTELPPPFEASSFSVSAPPSAPSSPREASQASVHSMWSQLLGVSQSPGATQQHLLGGGKPGGTTVAKRTSKKKYALQLLDSMKDAEVACGRRGLAVVDVEALARRLPGWAQHGAKLGFEDALEGLRREGLVIRGPDGRLRCP